MSKKAINSFFLYFCQFLLRFFLLVCSKDDKALDSNKLKSLVKSILFFCKKFFFASYILQSTRLAKSSKTFIDSIFLNSIKFNTFSGNLTWQISDHLTQFLVLKSFCHKTSINSNNVFERNSGFSLLRSL